MSDTDDNQLLDQALDLFVYAPIGLALEAREHLPRYIERGKGQVAMARVMSRFAAAKGQNEAGKVVSAAIEGFTTGLAGDPPSAAKRRGTGPKRAGTADVAQPPLENYDTLTAAKIVALLPGLSPAKVAAVQMHEAANRKRVTVLNRAAQLLDDA